MSKPSRIHVVGSSPRSGTTLAFELLTSCFEIDKFGEHEISLFERPKAPERFYASKKPTDLIHVKRLLNWDSKLYCLLMDRDPRDVVVSQHGSRPGEYWCDFPIWERNRQIADQLSGHPRFHLCRYEDLVRDPDSEQGKIAAAFPFLIRKHAFTDFERVSQSSQAAQLALKGVRRISSNSVGSWQKDLPRVAAQLRDFPQMAQAVADAGYAEDISWARACDGVAPDNRESVRALHDPLRGKGRVSRYVARLRRRAATLALESRYALTSLLS